MTSSEKPRVPYEMARAVAREIGAQLEPLCARIQLAGSLRRKRDLIGDIEFVVQPRTLQADIWGEGTPDVAAIRRAAATFGEVIKGGERMIQVMLRGGLPLEIYMVHPPAEWGSILAIRTGPANLAQFAVMRMQRYGRYHRDGRIVLARPASETGELIDDPEVKTYPTPLEDDFFAAAGLPCLPPWERDSNAAFTPIVMGE